MQEVKGRQAHDILNAAQGEEHEGLSEYLSRMNKLLDQTQQEHEQVSQGHRGSLGVQRLAIARRIKASHSATQSPAVYSHGCDLAAKDSCGMAHKAARKLQILWSFNSNCAGITFLLCCSLSLTCDFIQCRHQRGHHPEGSSGARIKMRMLSIMLLMTQNRWMLASQKVWQTEVYLCTCWAFTRFQRKFMVHKILLRAVVTMARLLLGCCTRSLQSLKHHFWVMAESDGMQQPMFKYHMPTLQGRASPFMAQQEVYALQDSPWMLPMMLPAMRMTTPLLICQSSDMVGLPLSTPQLCSKRLWYPKLYTHIHRKWKTTQKLWPLALLTQWS